MCPNPGVCVCFFLSFWRRMSVFLSKLTDLQTCLRFYSHLDYIIVCAQVIYKHLSQQQQSPKRIEVIYMSKSTKWIFHWQLGMCVCVYVVRSMWNWFRCCCCWIFSLTLYLLMENCLPHKYKLVWRFLVKSLKLANYIDPYPVTVPALLFLFFYSIGFSTMAVSFSCCPQIVYFLSLSIYLSLFLVLFVSPNLKHRFYIDTYDSLPLIGLFAELSRKLHKQLTFSCLLSSSVISLVIVRLI